MKKRNKRKCNLKYDVLKELAGEKPKNLAQLSQAAYNEVTPYNKISINNTISALCVHGWDIIKSPPVYALVSDIQESILKETEMLFGDQPPKFNTPERLQLLNKIRKGFAKNGKRNIKKNGGQDGGPRKPGLRRPG